MERERYQMKRRDRVLVEVRRFIYRTSYYLEYLMALAIIIAILLSLVSLPHQLGMLLDKGSESFTLFLRYIMNLIIGIELLHVVCRHNLDSVLEVLMLTVTRSIIIEHMATWEILIGVVAIGLLFAMRKYLSDAGTDEKMEKEAAPPGQSECS